MDPYTYIEKDTLISWGKKMTELNNEAIEIIKTIEEKIKELSNDYAGNAANGFTTVTSNLISDAEKYHNEMKDIEAILKEVVITAENQ